MYVYIYDISRLRVNSPVIPLAAPLRSESMLFDYNFLMLCIDKHRESNVLKSKFAICLRKHKTLVTSICAALRRNTSKDIVPLVQSISEVQVLGSCSTEEIWSSVAITNKMQLGNGIYYSSVH